MATETEPRARRGRPIKGYVYRRCPGGAYYVRYSVGSKETTVRLLDPVTQTPVTDKDKARLLADAITAPYSARNVVALRQSAVAALRTAQETAAEAERLAAAAKVRKIPLAELYDLKAPKLTVPRRPDSRKVRPLAAGTTTQHLASWRAFLRYMQTAWPGVRFAEDVTEQHAAAFAESRLSAEHLARTTVNNTVVHLSRLFRSAKLPDVWRAVPRYDTANEHESKEPLTVDELRTVCGSATGELRVLLALGVYTGMRLSDCCCCTWEDNIRLDAGRIIRRMRKTRRVVRVRLHDVLRGILSETPTDQRRGYVVPGMAALYAKRATYVSKLVTKHFRDCGLVTNKPASQAEAPRRLSPSVRTFHALRHTFVSLCAQSGVPQGAVAEWCGHSEQVSETYSHWEDKVTDIAILAALPTVLNGNGTKALPAAGQAQRDALRRLADTGTIEAVEAALAAGAAVKKGGA